MTRLPTIAPLTSREARSARSIRAGTVEHLDELRRLGGGATETADLMEAIVSGLDDALAEYSARPWYWRWLPPSAGHRLRLRPWVIEAHGELRRQAYEHLARGRPG